MGELRYTAFSYEDFVSRLQEWFQYQTMQENPIYYIFPSYKWLQSARKIQPGVSFQTFDDLAILLLDEAKVEFTKITEQERSLFFYDILNREQHFLSERELTKKAKAYSDSYGQLKRLGLKIEETPTQLDALTATFYTYEQEYRDELGMYDPENRIIKAIEAAGTRDTFSFSHVVIDGYMDFSPVQYSFIELLQKRNMPFTVYLPALNAPIIQDTQSTLQRMKVVANVVDVPSAKVRCEKTAVMNATTIEEEVYGVLESIAMRKGTGRYRDFGIVLATEVNYLPELERISKVKEIPILKAQKLPIIETGFVSFLKQIFLKEHLLTKWEQLPLVEAITALLFPTPEAFSKNKEIFIATGEISHPEINHVFRQVQQFKVDVPDRAMLKDYNAQLLQFLQQLPLMSIWRELIKQHNTTSINKIALEIRALQTIIEHLIKSLNSSNSAIKEISVNVDSFREKLISDCSGISLYLDRMPTDGIEVYSFRDVPLFTGKHLFVLGLNEGVFPKPHNLSGYFQERYLANHPSPFPLPLADVFLKKDDAAFEQLKYLAETLTFTYVEGMNPHQPLLASKYIIDESVSESFSTVSRLTSDSFQSEDDYEEKLAYYYGIGKKLSNQPEILKQYNMNLNYLEPGQELISSEWAEQLAKNTLSITGLERYAACSFRFGLERIFKVREPAAKQNRVDPIETGNMIHRIIESFYRDAKGIPFGIMAEFFEDKAEAKLLQIFEEEWEKLKQQHSELSQNKLEKSKLEWWKKFRRWLYAEQERFWNNGELAEMRIFRIEEPVQLSIEFGNNEVLTLTGKIDRVDMDEHGFVIYDYKTSDKTLDFNNHIPAGIVLQIPLYLIALEHEFNRGKYQAHTIKLGEPIGGGYISMKNPHQRKKNMVWKDDEHRKRFEPNSKVKTNIESLNHESLKENLKLDELIERLWRGTFTDYSVNPYNADQCLYCIYKPICRVTTEQQNA